MMKLLRNFPSCVKAFFKMCSHSGRPQHGRAPNHKESQFPFSSQVVVLRHSGAFFCNQNANFRLLSVNRSTQPKGFQHRQSTEAFSPSKLISSQTYSKLGQFSSPFLLSVGGGLAGGSPSKRFITTSSTG